MSPATTREYDVPDSQTAQQSDQARARAAAYGLIALGFQYPDQDTMTTLADPRRWAHWPNVLGESDWQAESLLQCVQDAVGECAAGAHDALLAWQQRYDDLFGHAVRGACPAFEMEYGRNEIIRQASDLADLAGFYRAFGMEIASHAIGRPDHISAECEFMSALSLKEAYAYEQGETDQAEICLDAQRTFLRDHLARWLPAFVHHLEQANASRLFGAVARFAVAFVKAECNRFDIHAGPATLELRTPDPVLDRTISCGSAGCGVGGAGEQFVQLGGANIPER